MKLLFVCTGNTCRSPMAEALAEQMAAERGLSLSCRSAGIYAVEGQKTTPFAQAALEELGIKGFSHSATLLTPSLLEEADLVIPMTEDHLTLIRQRFGFAEKLLAMPERIADPYGGTRERYSDCARQIQEALHVLAERGVFCDQAP